MHPRAAARWGPAAHRHGHYLDTPIQLRPSPHTPGLQNLWELGEGGPAGNNFPGSQQGPSTSWQTPDSLQGEATHLPLQPVPGLPGWLGQQLSLQVPTVLSGSPADRCWPRGRTVLCTQLCCLWGCDRAPVGSNGQHQTPGLPNHCTTHKRAARPLRSVIPNWYQFRDAIKAGGQSAGFSPMLAAQLSGVNDLMPIKLYQQPGRPRLISWLQVSEAKLGLRATEPMMIRRHVLRRPESTAGGVVIWVTVTPHKPPLLPVLVISQQDPGEVG